MQYKFSKLNSGSVSFTGVNQGTAGRSNYLHVVQSFSDPGNRLTSQSFLSIDGDFTILRTSQFGKDGKGELTCEFGGKIRGVKKMSLLTTALVSGGTVTLNGSGDIDGRAIKTLNGVKFSMDTKTLDCARLRTQIDPNIFAMADNSALPQISADDNVAEVAEALASDVAAHIDDIGKAAILYGGYLCIAACTAAGAACVAACATVTGPAAPFCAYGCWTAEAACQAYCLTNPV